MLVPLQFTKSMYGGYDAEHKTVPCEAKAQEKKR